MKENKYETVQWNYNIKMREEYTSERNFIDIKLELSHTRQIPALWERGGKTPEAAYAAIIGNNNGAKKRGMYQNKKDPNGKQMLIKIDIGDLIMFSTCVNNPLMGKYILRKVHRIDTEEKRVTLRLIYAGMYSGINLKYPSMFNAIFRKLTTDRCIYAYHAFKPRVKGEEVEKGEKVKEVEEVVKRYEEPVIIAMAREAAEKERGTTNLELQNYWEGFNR